MATMEDRVVVSDAREGAGWDAGASDTARPPATATASAATVGWSMTAVADRRTPKRSPMTLRSSTAASESRPA